MIDGNLAIKEQKEISIKLDGLGNIDIINIDTISYIKPKQICNLIGGLSINQINNYVARIKDDVFLKDFSILHNVACIEGGRAIQNRKTRLLQFKYLIIWISYINRNSLKKEQLDNIIKIYNFCLNIDIKHYIDNSKVYSYESLFRDEIFEIGYFDNIRIIDKEVTCDFGRIDLIGLDENNNKTIIELKRFNNYNDLIEQCLKYKNGFLNMGEDIRIIICAYDCSDFIEDASKCGFECYEYKRNLSVKKINIHSEHIGLENMYDFGMSKYLYNKQLKEEVLNYKNNVIKCFDNYSIKLNISIEEKDVDSILKNDIICYYLYICYTIDAMEFLEDFNDGIFNEDEVISVWVKQYFEDMEYKKYIRIFAL